MPPRNYLCPNDPYIGILHTWKSKKEMKGKMPKLLYNFSSVIFPDSIEYSYHSSKEKAKKFMNTLLKKTPHYKYYDIRKQLDKDIEKIKQEQKSLGLYYECGNTLCLNPDHIRQISTDKKLREVLYNETIH